MTVVSGNFLNYIIFKRFVVLEFDINCDIMTDYGEVAEWSKAHAWKACMRIKPYPGFEPLSLRQILFF